VNIKIVNINSTKLGNVIKFKDKPVNILKGKTTFSLNTNLKKGRTGNNCKTNLIITNIVYLYVTNQS